MPYPPQSILLVDDDSELLSSLARVISQQVKGVDIFAASTAEKALASAEERNPAVAVLDLHLGTDEGPLVGFRILRELLRRDPAIRVIVLTGNSSHEYGVQALDDGAACFLEKPPEIPHLIALIKDGLKTCALKRSFTKLEAEARIGALQKLVGSSRSMESVRKLISDAARTNLSVLICGETGTGKGVCAQLIHELSQRQRKNFVRYQPNFGSGDLVRSELFGHLRGSFTGAGEDRTGLIAEANGGTLFLDEIDELPPDTQVSLLDVIQERRYRRTGSTKYEQSDFRLIAACNQAIEVVLNSGKLRRDLYHRIAHATITLPPLRERREDVPELALAILGELRTRQTVNVFEISRDAIRILQSCSWPGNVRELQAAVEGAAYRALFDGRSEVVPADLASQGSGSVDAMSLQEMVDDFKASVVRETLKKTQGNQIQAAKLLQIDRTSLKRILDRVREAPHDKDL